MGALTVVGTSPGAVTDSTGKLTVTWTMTSGLLKYGDLIVVPTHITQGVGIGGGFFPTPNWSPTNFLGNSTIYSNQVTVAQAGVASISKNNSTGNIGMAGPGLILRGSSTSLAAHPSGSGTSGTDILQTASGTSPRSMTVPLHTSPYTADATKAVFIMYAAMGPKDKDASVGVFDVGTDLGLYQATPDSAFGPMSNAWSMRVAYTILDESVAVTEPAATASATWASGGSSRAFAIRGVIQLHQEQGGPSLSSSHSTITPQPTATNFFQFPYTVTDPDSGLGDIVTTTAVWGDGNSQSSGSLSNTHSHTYSAAGSYHVTITSTDLFGHSDVDAYDVVVEDPHGPVAAPAADRPRGFRVTVSELPAKIDTTMNEEDLWRE